MPRLLSILAAALMLTLPARADDLRFRRHDVNLESTFPAAAAIDVNEDGRLDIVSGGWWYEAPTWKKHFLREVQEIRGRYDDYSNLPLDVNGDGRLDLISANYRSESIFWIENPGPGGGEWPTHKVATPGNMETGRLYDVDGDGRLDLLPAGTKFSAWWSIDPTAATDKERWTRHDLPAQITGHGIGFGDVDGDGRGDIVGVTGWAQASGTRQSPDSWTWHDDFRLHRDASVPILVHDVDADGDADLIWGRGHRTGLYWLEHEGDDWTLHAIDTEFSQLHSLLLADLDNDGRKEVIAGKRYLGHDGKDVGEYDPMIVAAYSFDPSQRVWRRQVLDHLSRAGFDLDPRVVDLDADGDLDLLCPTRGGLCLLENQTESESITSTRRAYFDLEDHTDLSVYATAHPTQVVTKDDWGIRRHQILQGMQRAMGGLPDSHLRVALRPEFLDDAMSRDSYTRQKVRYDVAPGETVIAWLLKPLESDSRLPAMLCLHQTTRIGKDEPAAIGGKPHLHYAHELASQGYVCLVPDYPSFGEDDFDFAAHADRWQSGSMKAIWNNIRCIDFLETLPQVDPDRIGVIGHSLGGHNALFTAAFDQRIGAVVTSCGFTAFHSYKGGDLTGWTSLRYMPRIKNNFNSDPDQVPFDFHEVLGAIAPRPVFVSAPIEDSNFDVDGVREVVEEVQSVYDRMRSRDSHQLVLETPDCGHDFPDDVRERAYDWLDKVLK